MFYTLFSKPKRLSKAFTNTKQAVYKQELNKKTGERKLVKREEVDVYEKIQEFADETKISNILKKYQIDLFSKNLKEGEEKLIDLTNMPENLLETMTAIDNAKYLWERQSSKVKEKFNNDFRQFIAGSENGQLADILNKELKTSVERFTQITPEQRATMVAREQASKTIESPIPQNTTNTASSETITLEGGNK